MSDLMLRKLVVTVADEELDKQLYDDATLDALCDEVSDHLAIYLDAVTESLKVKFPKLDFRVAE